MWILHPDAEIAKEIMDMEAKIFQPTLYTAIKYSGTL